MSVNLGSQFMLSMHDVKVHRPMSLVSETFHWTNTLWVSALGLANKRDGHSFHLASERGFAGVLFYSVSLKKSPPRGPDIFSFFSQMVENL